MKNPRRMPACGSHVVISGGFNETVITFFKCGSTEQMLQKHRPVIALLDKHKKPYDIVYTNFVGKIVYEDDWQVAVSVKDGKMV